MHQNRIAGAGTLTAQLSFLLGRREMLFLWTSREIRARYRQSLLGIGWALLQPVFQVLTISIIFGFFVKIPSDGIPYPVFAYTGLLPWILFAGSISSGVPSLTGNMSLVTKIYFPREILPISSILARFVDFAIGSMVLVALMIWYRIPPHWTLCYIPLLLVIQTMLALGISLLGAAVSVFIRDVSFAMPMLIQLWMYATPVIYPLSVVPEHWQKIYLWNPMAGIIDSYRQVVLKGESPNLLYLGIATFIATGLCAIAYSYFKKLEGSMADVM